MAFEFPEDRNEEIIAYLGDREGEGSVLCELPIWLEGKTQVRAFVPLYKGKNILGGRTLAQTASLVVAARGRDGSCASYVKCIAEKLSELGIDDPAVTELWRALKNHE